MKFYSVPLSDDLCQLIPYEWKSGGGGGFREEVRENGETFVTKTYLADHSGRVA